MKPTVVLTLTLDDARQAIVNELLEGVARVVYLPALEEQRRAQALAEADALLCRHTGKVLRPGEAGLVRRARLVQFINSGLDFVPLGEFAPEIPIASNRGAYAGPIAEHAMALYLAASKRLLVEHLALRREEFNQFTMNREVAGSTCGILGLGGIGSAIARLARPFGMRIFGVNRRGVADVPVDRVGTLADLDELLREADVLMICAPLTAQTRGLIDARRLALMKPDAILVNLARGELVDQAALYRRLVDCPKFTACIEAWWVEPTRHGEFRLEQPFFNLPNFIGSPHNSASVPSAYERALRLAVENVRDVLKGAAPQNLLPDEERGLPAGAAG